MFLHTILQLKGIDNFEPWISMTNQGNLLTILNLGMLVFLRAYLGWSIETYGYKLSIIKISF